MDLKEFPLQAQNLWEKSSKMNHVTQFTNFCVRQITGSLFAALFNAPKKHALKQAVI